MNLDEQRAFLSVAHSERDQRFVWQDWIDSVLGHMKGHAEAMAQKSDGAAKAAEMLRKGDLRNSMIEFSPIVRTMDSESGGENFDII